MSRKHGNSLPPRVMRLLDGQDIGSKVGVTFLLLTVSQSNWPHVAMLSVGELVATSSARLQMALWQRSESGANLARTGQGTLMFVIEGVGYYTEFSANKAGDLFVGQQTLDRFECRVERVLYDEAKYARLTSGIVFELPEPDKVVARWENTVAAMVAAAG